MEIELSTVRAQLARVSNGSSAEREQITALEEKLARSEKMAELTQGELGDLKKNLERTAEKAVKEGGEKASAETKLRTLEREAQEAKSRAEGSENKVDGLEKKIVALGALHKEHDARSQALKRDLEKSEKECAELKSRLAKMETENQRLKDERDKMKKSQALGEDDGIEDLENEERVKLERRVRELESEVHELRGGVYDKQRRNLAEGEDGSKFTDVDLSGDHTNAFARRKSVHGGGLGNFLTSGFNAITGAAGHQGADEGLLDDDDMDFDESAFRQAQEEEATRRLERVKEIKRGLKNWEGWRMDVVEQRRSSDNALGEIFEL